MSLRILMTLDAAGGVWRYAIDLAAALHARSHEVILAGLGPRPTAAQRAEAEAVGRLEWGEAPLDWMAGDASALEGVAPWLEELVRTYRPDVLHLNLPSQAAGLGDHPPVVTVCHSCLATWFRAVEVRSVPDRLSWLARLTRDGIDRAAVVLAPSAAHARLTEEVYGIGEVAVVPNASATASLPPSEGDGSVVAAARWWDGAKNGTTLDRAAGQVEVPVVMIGACEGGEGSTFAARNAATTGALSHADTIARIAGASLFASPSIYEPFGLAALEAARSGRPLLLADIPVYREIWEGAARFFPPRDAEALAAEIDALAADPEARLRLGAAAQMRARDHIPAAQSAAMETVYLRTLSARAEG
ncbi:glycosyltransferase family 4 protein [Celeribacter indicus]|uniref:Group 1 glycosyl transferase n=1 Tax=Celeribacter indicus TaxID=1208324 RepID=A0A0B5E6I8_9RHOB|nr:glycosyltransferase family 4 protein [Celeribacter indicus]AJE49065.1 group 1 glycosyl transferase [Celeribacter indicus]SDW45045.1 Glycosyltransferase involved in cell wall bisynthesis [Celeribacter indicus]